MGCHCGEGGEQVKSKVKGYINLDLGALFVGTIVVGAVIGVAISFIVPWVWEMIKPILHSLTA